MYPTAADFSQPARVTRRVNTLVPGLCAGSTFPEAKPAFRKLLVANRGEIAIRVFRAAKSLGIATVAVFAVQDKGSLHVDSADESFLLPRPEGQPIAPYLEIEEIIRIAKECKADAIHPGYGFLAESSAFSSACAKNGITFVGPTGPTIDLFGDKTAAKNLATQQKVPIARGSGVVADGKEAVAFLKAHNVPYPVIIKAVFGGGGRGQKMCRSEKELLDAFSTCSREVKTAETEAKFLNAYGLWFFQSLHTRMLKPKHVLCSLTDHIHRLLPPLGMGPALSRSISKRLGTWRFKYSQITTGTLSPSLRGHCQIHARYSMCPLVCSFF